jgi:hypothetical protein
MFTWLNKQGVRSDSGFEVQFTGRFDAEYREGYKLVELYIESGIDGGLPCIMLDPNSFDHWSDGQPIATEQQAQMLKNFKEAMAFQGLKTVVEHRTTAIASLKK